MVFWLYPGSFKDGERSVLINVVWRFDSKLCRLGGGAGRDGEPGVPACGRPGDGATNVVEVAAARGTKTADFGELGAWSRLNTYWSAVVYLALSWQSSVASRPIGRREAHQNVEE